MRRTIIHSFIIATALAVVGPVLASPSAIPRASSSPTPAPSAAAVAMLEQAPTPAMQTAGLCGITQSDVLDIAEYYDLDPDMDAVQSMLAVPFDCDAYGQLCTVLDPPDAHAYVCGVWARLDAHVDAIELQQWASDTLSDSAQECPADLEKCEDLCDPYGLLSCDGIRVGTKCKQLAVCDVPVLRWLLGFDDLVVIAFP